MNEVIARINSLVDYVDIAIKDDHGEAMFKNSKRRICKNC